MLELTVNKIIFQTFDNNEMTLDDLYKIVASSANYNKNIITETFLDGKILSFDEEEQYRNSNLLHVSTVELKAQNSLELAFEAVHSCTSYLDNVIFKIEELTKLFSANKIQQANLLFVETIGIMDLFVQLISKINTTLVYELGDKYQKNKDIHQLEIHLLSVMKALLPAKERDDIIMLCDLLEYELKDNLIQWKIKVIPSLKNLQNNLK